MKSLLFVILSAALMMFSASKSEYQALESKVYNWNKLDVVKTKTGERRQILEGSTDVFEHFEIHVTTLHPGESPHGSHTHLDHEELIIVKDGMVKQTIGNDEKILGPGSIILAMPGDEHGISNAGNTQASYYIIKWKTKDFELAQKPKEMKSLMLDWKDLEYNETQKGGRRNVMRQATSMLQELEMHVTTLNEGIQSHGQHTHADEEIILILKGEVEEMIDDQPYPAEAGSLIFLTSEIPHGIRNNGNGQCEYFAIRWIPKQ